MPAQLTSLTMPSPSSMNQSLSIAATKTTHSSSPLAVSEPAVQEAAQPWEPRSVLRGTVLGTVKCRLSRKPLRIEHNVDYQQQHGPRELLHGVQPDAMSGSIKAAVITQPADKEDQRRASGLTTSQVT